MRSWPVDAVADGEYAAPHELNAELREETGALHDLDNDNFAAARIATTKIANGAWGNLHLSNIPTGGELTIHQPGNSSGAVYSVPGNAVAQWLIAPTVADCSLKMSLGVFWRDDTLGQSLRLWVGIRLDGQIVAQSPSEPAERFYGFTSFVRVQIPVPAGTRLIEPIYGIHDSALGAIRTVTWLGRTWSGLEVAR